MSQVIILFITNKFLQHTNFFLNIRHQISKNNLPMPRANPTDTPTKLI